MKVRQVNCLRMFFLVFLTICLYPATTHTARAAEFRLTAKVDVQYDKLGVPHITASNDADLYFAQGYVTACDRRTVIFSSI